MANIDISYVVAPVKQSNDWCCWAAAAAMLLSWKNNLPCTDIAAAQTAGQIYVDAFNQQTGLLGSQIQGFANALNFKTEAPQNWTPDGYNQLLTTYGPLWIGTAIFSGTKVYKHVRVLYALKGDGTFDGTIASLIDPFPTSQTFYQESLTQLATELEEIAKQDLEAGDELKPQVIHSL
jgi:hypothetical protein